MAHEESISTRCRRELVVCLAVGRGCYEQPMLTARTIPPRCLGRASQQQFQAVLHQVCIPNDRLSIISRLLILGDTGLGGRLDGTGRLAPRRAMRSMLVAGFAPSQPSTGPAWNCPTPSTIQSWTRESFCLLHAYGEPARWCESG